LANTSPCWNPNASIFLSRALERHLAFPGRQPRTNLPGVLPTLLDRASGVCISGMIHLATMGSAPNDGSLVDLEPRTLHGQSMMDDLTKREVTVITAGLVIGAVLIVVLTWHIVQMLLPSDPSDA
jgi:hypothetical protein